MKGDYQDEILRGQRDPYRHLYVPVGCFGPVILTGLVGVVWWALDPKVDGSIPALSTLMIVVGVVVVGVGIHITWPDLPAHKLGRVRAHLDPKTARPGETIASRISFRPNEPLVLRGITVRLICERHWPIGVERVLDISQAVYRGGLPKHEEQVFEGELQIPASGPAMGTGNAKWFVHTEIDIPSWPDWWQREQIVVEPDPQLTPLPPLPARPLTESERIRVTVQQGQSCPFCRDAVAGLKPAQLITCGGCKTVFHRACMAELNTCTTRGCRNRVER